MSMIINSNLKAEARCQGQSISQEINEHRRPRRLDWLRMAWWELRQVLGVWWGEEKDLLGLLVAWWEVISGGVDCGDTPDPVTSSYGR